MDDVFFEDTISIVNYTDSQKSIATNNAHSPDRTDTSSGKSRGTYVIAVDSDLNVAYHRGGGSDRDHRGDRSDCDQRGGGSDRNHRGDKSDRDQRGGGSDRYHRCDGSDHEHGGDRKHRIGCTDRRAEGDVSDRSDGSWRLSPPYVAPALIYDDCGVKSANPSELVIRNSTLAEEITEVSDVRPTSKSVHACSLISQEIFTQTSKTIFELAQINHLKCSNIDTNAIETQTSRVSIVETKTTEYRIEVSGSRTRFARQEFVQDCAEVRPRSDPIGGTSLDDPDRASSETLKVIEEESSSQREFTEQLELSDETSENAYSLKYDTDFTDSLEDDHFKRVDQDNISETSVPRSVDRDVEELYTKLEESFNLRSFDKPEAVDVPRHGTLSPLTEETAISKPKEKSNKNVGIKPELKGERSESRGQCRLPPIQRQLSPRSPRWSKFGTPSPGAPEHEAASAFSESATGRITKRGRAEPALLPAIVGRGVQRARNRADAARSTTPRVTPRAPLETISISGKIQQLKLPVARKTSESRSSSPGAEVATRGADALAADVLARLRQATSTGASFEPLAGVAGAARVDASDCCGAKWAEAVEVLEDVPALFRGFWGAVPEHRVADLLRLVTAQVESPRTRVASCACAAMAAVLENTGYTKKPEFTEAVSALLVKTGSCVAPLRRAANLALDGVVARAPPAAAVAALCHAGLEHKSGAVRSATARLLVVSAALARGGRELLRARPPSAAAARRAALRALSTLLQDRSQDTRRYAERLYVMLRPLEGFAAFFLADVDARTACRQMKKYDQLLARGSSPPASPR